MSNNIERLNYYEREYLRSFDFIAEQNYHMEMRRRLNLALHLWGIVDGLEVLKGVLAPGLPEQFYISPGMAIDAFGREIVLVAPYPLSDDDLRDNHISGAGSYSVWIYYQHKLSTPPGPGYRVCDIKDQYTRWRESARILIANNARAGLAEPRVFDALSDDPKKYPWPILLGTIDVTQAANNPPFINTIITSPGQREYIGLRTQRIIASVSSESNNPPQYVAPDLTRPITVEADLRETKNLIVGQEFTIDTNTVKPPPDPNKFPDPTKFPGPTGNVRVENNLFLKGDLYKSVGNEWLALKEYVQTRTAEIQTDTTILTPPAPPADPTTGTSTITLTSQRLKNPVTVSIMVALSGIEWKNKTDQTTWWGQIGGNTPIQIKVNHENLQNTGPNQFSVDFRWTVLPQAQPSNLIQVQKLTVSYIAVFHP